MLKRILKKTHLLNTVKKFYYLSTNLEGKFYNRLFPTARILLYHRIADVKNDPHLLSVSPDNFREQLKYLNGNFRVVPLLQLADELRLNKIRNNTIAVTFDDGYADNLHAAVPILKELNVPATIFITADSVGKKLFYWDKDNPEAGRPLSENELKEMTKTAGLIELGTHTLTHPRLSKIPLKEQEREILESKNRLETIINVPTFGFAYPFGDKNSFNKDTLSSVKKAGYRYACANIHERVTHKSDIYALPRFVVRNWPAEELKKQIKKWI